MIEMSQPKREAFSQRMTDILNYGALNLAMAIGYRAGLFEVMASFSSPQPTAAIAAHTSQYDNRNHPLGPFLYTVSLMHCLPVGLVDGGVGLGMMLGQEQAVAMLQQAGFARVEVQEMPEDPFNLHFCCRK